MEEIKRILELKKEDRTQADLSYLKSHEDNLTADNKLLLIKDHNLEFDILEEYENDFKIKGMIGKKVYKTFTATVKDEGEGIMEAVISTNSIDRHGEIVDIKGMNIKEYMDNPIMADGHDYSKPSVGRTLKLTKKSDGRLIAKFEWAKDIYERANILYNLYKNKFQFAFSIGFTIDDMDGNTFTKTTLLEFSPVLIPANPEAVLLAKQKGIKLINKNGIDNIVCLNYNGIMELKLEDVKAKNLEDLTVREISFLKEHSEDLTKKELKTFASVLEVKKDEPKDEPKDDIAEVIAKAVQDAVAPLKETVEELKNADPTNPKNIADKSFSHNKGEVSKEMKFLYYARGLKTGNFTQYLDAVGKDAMNTSDDSQVIAPVEFDAEVQRLEEEYGVARKFALVRRSTSGNGIQYTFGGDDLEIFDTAESGVKKSTQNSYTSKTLLWRKFAGILPITDELSEDSAINLWADATNRYARAFAKKEDELVFTNTSAVSPQNKGILEVAGVNSVVMSGTGSDDDFEDIAYEDLVDMLVGVPTASQANGRFYFHRTLLGALMKLKDDEGRPLWLQAVSGGAPATILNKPYELVEVMPAVSDSAPNTAFMAFGDLKLVTLGERTGINIKMFDAGTVGDPDEDDQDANTINLLTQDVQVMRAVKRMNAVVRFPAGFSILSTGNPSS